MKRASLLLLAAALVGCLSQTRPPPGWQQGGAPLLVQRATWNAGWTSVEVLLDGRVIVNGVDWFVIDAAGRVLDGDGEPVAMLQPDGRLLGVDGEDMGFVGVTASSAPGASHATSAIAPNGQVYRYDEGGHASTVGAWSGCGPHPATLHACTLVTHLVSLRFPMPRSWNRTPTTPYGPFTPGLPSMAPGFGFGLMTP